MKLSRVPFHSLLFSLYPIAYLYATNIVFIPFQDTLRALVVSAGLAVFFSLCFFMIVKSWEKAGMLCSLLVILFFSFGHVANLFTRLSFDVKALAWVWLVLFLALTFVLLQARPPGLTTQFLNAAGLVLLAFPLITILSTLVSIYTMNSQPEREKLSQIRQERAAEASLAALPPQVLPDIYYIILDSYERADLLETLYGYDNSAFITTLTQRGFYVAPASHSNFLNTTYSLNTALNLVYYSDFPRSLLMNARYNLRTNYVSDFLRERGYQVVVFDSGTGDSNNQYADVFVSPNDNKTNPPPVVNAFETMVIRTTVGLLLFKGESRPDSSDQDGPVLADTVNRELNVRRERISHALNHLPDYARADGPHFLFAHIYLPHFPFLYGPGGKELKYHGNMNLFWYEPEPENYIDQYIDQIKYVNGAVLAAIDRILETSQEPVVIILQSDHGDSRFIDWDEPTAEGIRARSATLNAFYYSDRAYESLYPTMTTVNTFRLVFNHWFGTSYPLLPETVFFHKHSAETGSNAFPRFWDACVFYNFCLPDPQ